MKKVEIKNVKPYQAPKHFNMTAMRLHGKEESGATKFWMGLSHFLPGGGAEYDENSLEKIYFVLDGEVTIKTKKEEITLKALDSIFIGPGEGREIIHKINVNCIAPGVFRSPITNRVFEDPAFNKMVLGRFPIGRLGEPEDFIGAV